MLKKIFNVVFLLIINLLLIQLYLAQQSGLLRLGQKGVLYNNSTKIDVSFKELDVLKIEEEINNYRLENNLNSLIRYPNLCKLAVERVTEIQTDWSHEGFKNRDDAIYVDYCNNDNLICTSAGENLAKGQFKSEEQLVLEWIKSPEHNKNMLSDYNVQCVAANNNHYVSLFAKTTDLEKLEAQEEAKLDRNIEYNYEKVIFWENQIINNNKYLDNWNDKDVNKYYNKDNINLLISELENKIEIATKLWDGITNQKISVRNEKLLEKQYLDSSNKASSLSKSINLDAYNKCSKDLKESDVCNIFIE